MPYNLDELSSALVNADKAGDADGAKAIAAEISKLRSTPTDAPSFGERALQGTKDPLFGAAQLAERYTPTGIADFARKISSAFETAPQQPTLTADLQGDSGTFRPENMVELAARQNAGYEASRGPDAGFDWGRLLGNIGATAPLSMIGGPGMPAAIATGAATGALQPIYDNNNFETKKLVQTGLAAAFGAGGNLLARGLSKIAQHIANRGTAPTAAALKAESQAAYEAADAAGVIIAKDSFKKVAGDIQKKMAEEGIDATIHPKAMAALKRLTDVDENVTLHGADILRQVLRGAASSNEASERRLGAIMIDKLDDYIGGLKPSDVVSGDSKVATAALSEARGLWSRARKSELIDGLIEKARNRASQFSGSGYENALRTEFRGLLRNMRAMRGFNEAEREAIRHVARGGPVENVLRMAGKFAPTGVVSSALSGGTGYAIGGPAGAAALPVAGFAARRGATAMTAANAQKALEMMQRGGPSPQLNEALLRLIYGAGPLVQSSLTNAFAPR